MDLKLLTFHRPSPLATATAAVPLLVSNQSTTSLSFSLQKSPFVGTNLSFHQNNFNFRKQISKFSITVAGAVKRRKELPFDNVIQRDKKLKLVLKIRNILVKQPDRIMSLRELGKYRRDLGLTRKRRFIALLKRFPAVFDIVEEGVYSLKFRLTTEAERIYLEELRARNEMEGIVVVKLRKLLMMSLEKRILIEKIAHLKNDLGLPTEFGDTICKRYPQYFRVVSTDRGPALELTHWCPDLALSAAELAEEDNRIREQEERNLIIDRPPKFNRVKLPRGLNLSKGEMRRIEQFKKMPYISPYSDFSELRSGSPEKEKHACGVIHEILSFTLEKRTLVDHLTHFREEFRFSQQLRGMIIRHPDMFYVSLKGDRDSVFLREAYRDSQLVEKDKLLLMKEKLRALVAVPRFSRRIAPKTEVAREGEDDVDNLLSDELGSDFDDDDDDDEEGDYDGEDDWSDEDDEITSDFGEDETPTSGKSAAVKLNGSDKNEEKVLVFPDGRLRERW